jgi:O-methyltransferase
MKLFLIRYTKIVFLYLRLHKIFNPLSSAFLNLYYLTKLSDWASRNKAVRYNDFPCKWNYEKRYDLYQWVIEEENLTETPVNYLEFGVSRGYSFRWFLKKLRHSDSRFYGFDTFTGLPEDWGPFKKGSMANDNKAPEIDDARGKFFQGLFQQTLPAFLEEFDPHKRNLILLDADLFSATLYTLTRLAPFLKKGDIILFDEFAVPTHEFKAFDDFLRSYYVDLELIAAANNYYFAAFKIV